MLIVKSSTTVDELKDVQATRLCDSGVLLRSIARFYRRVEAG